MKVKGDVVGFGELWGLELSQGTGEGGPAVYHVALYFVKSFQKVVALNLGGMMTVPPECKGARKPANRPWTWNRGMTR
jgi:hypothetical protein